MKMTKIDAQLWRIPDLLEGFYMAQVHEFIIENIQQGILLPNTYLPPYREVAQLNGINRNTILRVFNKLQEQGWVIAQPGKGIYVSPNYPGHDPHDPSSATIEKIPVPLQTPQRAPVPEKPKQTFATIGFDIPSPYYFPVSLYYKYMRFHTRRYGNVKQMQQVTDAQGLDFKDAILTHLNVMRGFNLSPASLDVIMGRRESLDALFKVLVSPGDVVVNTSPQDLEIQGSLNELEAKIEPMSTLDPDFISKLSAFLQHTKIKVLHVRPQCGYPENNHLSPEICRQLVQLAREHAFYILEEDEYHEFWYKPQPYTPLVRYNHNGHVIYLGVLSLLTPYMQNTRVIAAAEEFIALLKMVPLAPFRYRNIIEEKVIANILRSGELWKYAKKARMAKEVHRYEITMEMQNYLQGIATIYTPDSGLSLWLNFGSDESLLGYMRVIENTGTEIPYIPGSQLPGPGVTDIRLGYGTWHVQEAEGAAKLMKEEFNAGRGSGKRDGDFD